MRIKSLFKQISKSQLMHKIMVKMIYLYLLFVYKTAKWQIVWQQEDLEQKFDNMGPALISFWHNRLAFCFRVFEKYRDIKPLASSHRDGRMVIDVIKLMNRDVIEGSTNKNPIAAVKVIMQYLKTGGKVIITPDGPRGPIYQINSSITKIAHKQQVPLIPVSCMSNKYWQLDSWDKMMVPKPFSEIYVVFGKQLELSGDEEIDKKILADSMMNLSDEAEKLMRNSNR